MHIKATAISEFYILSTEIEKEAKKYGSYQRHPFAQ